MATTHVERTAAEPAFDLRAAYLLVPGAAMAVTWGLPYIAAAVNILLAPLHLRWSTLDPLPYSLEGLHIAALTASVASLYWSLRRSYSPVVREFSLVGALLAAGVFAFALDMSATRLPAGNFDEMGWTSGGLFPWDLLGIALAAGGTVMVRRRAGLPALMPVSKITLERLLLLLARGRAIASQIVHNKMAVVGLSLLVFFTTVAVVGPHFFSFNIRQAPYEPYLPPSRAHLLGTDNLGQDILAKLVYGAGVSLTIGILAAAISSVIGTAVGLISGYVGGWKDEALMRMNDVLLSLPTLVLLIMLAAVLKGKLSLAVIILIIGLTSWSYNTRIVRAQVLSVKERMFVERARAIGSGDSHIVMRHIFPNVFPLVFANMILTVSTSILYESTLAFLGLVPDDIVTWGKMLAQASFGSAWTNGLYGWILAPGFSLVFLILGFSLLGYSLDEILNPKLKRR